MATLKIKKSDGTWAGILPVGGLLYCPQDLTAEQKQTARDNIGAVAARGGGGAGNTMGGSGIVIIRNASY